LIFSIVIAILPAINTSGMNRERERERGNQAVTSFAHANTTNIRKKQENHYSIYIESFGKQEIFFRRILFLPKPLARYIQIVQIINNLLKPVCLWNKKIEN
jgi:hypothetical protein